MLRHVSANVRVSDKIAHLYITLKKRTLILLSRSLRYELQEKKMLMLSFLITVAVCRMYNEEHESVIVDTFQGQFRNKVTMC